MSQRQQEPELRLVSGGKPSSYECFNCHLESKERLTHCPRCNFFDTFVAEDEEPEVRFLDGAERPAKKATQLSTTPTRFTPTGYSAWDEALGGGFVRPSSVLISGPSGVGKSTRALSLAIEYTLRTKKKALYGSAEMPAEHVRMYADRLGYSKKELEKLWIQDSGDALDFLSDIDDHKPGVIVWDSIQRFLWEGELGEKELGMTVTAAIHAGRIARSVSLLICHVTKEDIFSGPNGLRHDVDVHLDLRPAGDELEIHCASKNRFASTPRVSRERLFPPKEDERLPTIDDDEVVQRFLHR